MPSFDSSSIVITWPLATDYRVAAFQGDFVNNAHHVWLDLTLTYSFPDGPTYFNAGTAYGSKNEVSAWNPLTLSQQQAATNALTAWSNVAGVRFVQVDDDLSVGDLRFALTGVIPSSSNGHAYQPSPNRPESGDVWLTSRWAGLSFGSAPSQTSGLAFSHDTSVATRYLTLLHEIGHALGLSHTFTETDKVRYTAALPEMENSAKSSVMTYAPLIGQFGAPNRGIPTTPMVYDILAIQYMYGPNQTYNAGNTTYVFDMSDVRLETIWDAGGNDTIVTTNRSGIFKVEAFYRNPTDFNSTIFTGHRGVQIDLRPAQGISPLEKGVFGGLAGNMIGFVGDYASKAYVNEGTPAGNPGYGLTYLNAWTNIYIAYNTWIENAVGTSANDILIGNAENNRLTGGGGHDRIDGQEGIDTAVYTRPSSDFSVIRTATGFDVRANFTETFAFPQGWIGTGGPGIITPTDLLQNIERIEFSDRSLAFDLALNQSAGKAARIIGALLDTPMLTPEVAGIAISLFDKNFSMLNVAQLIIDHPVFIQLAGSNSHAALVNTLFTNIANVKPAASDLSYFVGLLERGEISRAQLAVSAAESSFNDTNIGLVGLQDSGLAFIPYA